jgi:hypothetical protein
MKALRGSQARLVGGLVVSVGLALVAGQPLAAHAASLPTISASVTGRTTIQVSGFGFGSGDRVEVVDSLGDKVFTISTRTIVPPPPPYKCKPSVPCQFLPVILGGRIAVTMPPHLAVELERVSVRAYDLSEHTRSNRLSVMLGPVRLP